jgi:hypothetical protein
VTFAPNVIVLCNLLVLFGMKRYARIPRSFFSGGKFLALGLGIFVRAARGLGSKLENWGLEILLPDW